MLPPRTGYTAHRVYLDDASPRLVDQVSELVNASPLTVEQMCQQWQVSRHFINQIENPPDDCSPSADAMQRIYQDLTGEPLLDGPPSAASSVGQSGTGARRTGRARPKP